MRTGDRGGAKTVGRRRDAEKKERDSNQILEFTREIKNITDEDGINARFTDVFGVGATGVKGKGK